MSPFWFMVIGLLAAWFVVSGRAAGILRVLTGNPGQVVGQVGAGQGIGPV